MKLVAPMMLSAVSKAELPNLESKNNSIKRLQKILSYAIPVFHYALPKYLKDEEERIQKQALPLFTPCVHYRDA